MALLTGLISFYSLDDRLDATASNNDLTNNTSVTFAAGKISDGGVYTGASNQCLELAAASAGDFDFDSTDSFTVAGWFKYNNLPSDNEVICAKYDSGSGSDRQWSLHVSFTGGDAILRFETADGTLSDTASSVQTLSTGTWYHLVGTYTSGGDMELFFNSTSVDTHTPIRTLASNGGNFGVGCYFNNGSIRNNTTWDGMLDEVGIWSRVLTQGEINDLYNSGAGFAYPFVAPGPATLKTWNTVAAASAKTSNTAAIGTVKTINTAS